VAGQLVKTLVDDVREPGRVHTVTWKGVDDNGTRVATGIYFCRLEAIRFTATKKMILLK